jgi:hypothetical protein
MGMLMESSAHGHAQHPQAATRALELKAGEVEVLVESGLRRTRHQILRRGARGMTVRGRPMEVVNALPFERGEILRRFWVIHADQKKQKKTAMRATTRQ